MILHLDADAFFASCEQSANSDLRGKPVVVGGERGIVTAVSYEAKALGVKRGMPTWQLKYQFPTVFIANSNYQSYEEYSQQILHILEQVTPYVEPYSIDESFADVTSIDKMKSQSWEEIAQELQQKVWDETMLGVSIGIAPTKVLAKIASGWHKPKGITVIRSSNDTRKFLEQVPIQDVWGIGWQTQKIMLSRNIKTAYDFYNQPPNWIKQKFSVPFQNIYQELHGNRVYEIDSKPKETYNSISKTRTFYPFTSDADKLFSYLIRNLDRALEKCRKYNLQTIKITIFLKTHAPNANFKSYFAQTNLIRPTNLPQDLIPTIRHLFLSIYRKNLVYRSTGIILNDLISNNSTQLELGESGDNLQNKISLVKMVDLIRNKYGHKSVYLGSTYHAMNNIDPTTERVGLKVKVSF